MEWREVVGGQTAYVFFFYFINLFIFLYIYFWLRCVFVARRLPLVVAIGGYSLLQCAGFLWWLLLLRTTGSRHAGFSSCGSRALERRLRSCGAWASMLRDMRDLPRPGLEPVSPALASELLTTEPPGKPLDFIWF